MIPPTKISINVLTIDILKKLEIPKTTTNIIKLKTKYLNPCFSIEKILKSFLINHIWVNNATSSAKLVAIAAPKELN